MTIYFFVKNVVTFVWHLLQICRFCRLMITFSDARSSCYQIDQRTVWLYPSLAWCQKKKKKKKTWFFQDLQSLHLHPHRFIHPYLVTWVFMFFNDFFSNFLTPGNAARIYCWHRGSSILVKNHVIIWVHVTSMFLYQITSFFIFILIKGLRISILRLVTETTLTKWLFDQNPCSLIQEIVSPGIGKFQSVFWYLTLKCLIIPASRDWSLDLASTCI